MNPRHFPPLAAIAALIIWLGCVMADFRHPVSLSSSMDTAKAAATLLDLAESKAGKYGVTGAYVGVISGDDFFGRGIGFADLKNKQPVTEHTAFNIGSVSKPITAWGVLALADDGLIELDAPAEKYLTQWRFPPGEYDASQATVRRLLQHTAGTTVHGYAGYPSLSEPEKRPFRQTKYPPRSLAESSSTNYPVKIVREPGRHRIYSGGGYAVLQMLIEDVAGLSFSRYMRERVFLPAGMSGADFQLSNVATPSKGYNYKGDVLPDMEFHALAAAGMYASGSDILAFFNAQLNEGGNVLSPEYARQLLEPVPANELYAMSYTRRQSEMGVLFGHGGNNSAWHAQIYFMPEKNQGFFFLTNSSTGAQFEIDVSCAWKAWLLDKRAGELCRGEYDLTRNLSIATAVIGTFAILLFGRIGSLAARHKISLSIWPRHYGALRNISRLVAIIFMAAVSLFLCVVFFSDFFYWREGVVFRDEIPLHEMRLMIPAILLLQGSLFISLLAARKRA